LFVDYYDLKEKKTPLEEKLSREILGQKVGEWITNPTTYAGGNLILSDSDVIKKVGNKKIDFPLGSALDIF